MTNYSYELAREVRRDVTAAQERKLASEGYVKEADGAMRKYREVWKDFPISVVKWKERTEIEVPVNSYEEETIQTRWTATYSEKPRPSGWLGGLWRRVTAPFERLTKEIVTDLDRRDELREMLSRGEITKLELAESKKVAVRRLDFTKEEAADALGSGKRLRLEKANVGKKKVPAYQIVIQEMPKSDYPEFEKSHEVLFVSERTEKRLVEKVLEDERERGEVRVRYYKPGVWSSNGKDQAATFIADLAVEFMTGFNPLDKEFVDFRGIEAEIVDIIKNEHGNAVHIERRNDGQNGFTMLKPHVGGMPVAERRKKRKKGQGGAK